MTSPLRAALACAILGFGPAAGMAQLASLKAPRPVTEPEVIQAAAEEVPDPAEPAPAPETPPPAPEPGPLPIPGPLTATVAPVTAAPGLYSTPVTEFMCQTCRPAGPWCVIAPYVWVFGMEGTVGAGSRVQQVDISVKDAADQLSNLRGAAQLHLEAGYGDFGLLTDLTYLNLVPVDRLVKVESRSTLLELLGTYRLMDQGGGGTGTVTLEVLAGARYYNFSNSITLNPVDLTPVDRENTWVDAVVGARLAARVLDDLWLYVRGDVGGFDWGDSSRRAINVIAGFEYRLGDACSLYGGYRWFKIDRTHGVGPEAFLLDVTLAGPFLALGWKF